MDEFNNEGILGTDKGALYYINFNEKIIIKIVNKANPIQDEISLVKFNEHNPQMFLSNCGSKSSFAKLWTTESIDLVTRFVSPKHSPVAAILSATSTSSYSMICHQNGLVRLCSIENLRIEANYQVKLDSKDETLTAAVYNPNGTNFAIGTNFGNIYLGSVKTDGQGKPKLSLGKLDNIQKNQMAITSL
jgi:hypothetical protein